MNRRLFLQSVTIGTASAIAGCSGRSQSTEEAATVSDTVMNYPYLAGVYYPTTAHQVNDPEKTLASFEELSTRGRMEFVNAISRDQYLSEESHLLHGGYNQAVISYRGSTFDISVGVGDDFSPEHGPKFDPNWTDPVDLTADVSGDELTVAITNDLDAPLAVHHYGRPYFGVLIAVNGASFVVDHDHYEENEHVQTTGVITTERISEDELQTETLSPGESLRESYFISGDFPAKSTIWLSLPIGDSSIEMFGNQRTTMAGTITLEM